MGVKFKCIEKEDFSEYLLDVAQLRIRVFREYPYLYDGDVAYEERYLKSLADAQHPTLAIIQDEGEVVGATTAMALKEAAVEFQQPFVEIGETLNDYYYCAESVLLPQYRGQGFYRSLFQAREDKAREIDARYCVFCAVVRPEHHHNKPQDYRPLDAAWRHLGYAPLEGVEARLHWKEVDSEEQIAHRLAFWRKAV